MKTTKDVGERVTLYPDGKYRWVCEVNMLKNPSILFDVWKVLGISIGILVAFFALLIACDGDINMKVLSGLAETVGLLIAIFAVISILGYLLFAAMSGWKYVVLFIMDEKEVVHQQMPSQVKKAKVIGALTVLVGLFAGKPGVVGTGVLSQARMSMTSTLAHVSRLIPCRRMHLIKVNQRLSKNRIYVHDEDFDFVYDFLCQHCVKAKK
jgi:hypothetical protein